MSVRGSIEQQILSLVESTIEDTRIPDAIAEYASKRADKPVTKTDAEKLQAQLGVPVRIRRQYGMTHVSWAAGEGLNPWSDERSILLAHSETNVRWPSGTALRSKERAYFGARDERNADRKKLLGEYSAQETWMRTNTLASQADRTSVVSRAAAAIAKLREARAELDALLAYGEPLNVVSTGVEKLAKGEA